MIGFFKELWSYFRLVWNSKFKYMLLLFALWLYRIDFMPDTGGGLAKVVQIISLLGLLYMMKKYRNGILGYSFAHTNTATKSCLWLYVYGVISTLWAFMPSMAFFMAFQNVVMIMLMVWYFSMFRDFQSMERGFIVFTLSMVLFESVFLSTLSAIIGHSFFERSLFFCVMLCLLCGRMDEIAEWKAQAVLEIQYDSGISIDDFIH